MRAAFLLLGIFAVVATAYDFTKPKNGTELEQTLRSELDDIWVVQWYQDVEDDQKRNEANSDVQMLIQKTCPELNKEYKFVRADLDPEKQRDEENTDRDTDFKELMLKLKIDDADFTVLTENTIVSVMYRLNGVKVFGDDLEVKVCDFIEAKKEERAAHEREVARKNADNTPTAPTPPPPAPAPAPAPEPSGPLLHPGGHRLR